jgi:pyrroline-5-carboxylate reductase
MTAWPKSLALVGAGKMGGAMLRGWLAGGLKPEDVAILDPAPAPDIVDLARGHGLALTPSAGMKPEVLVLAVKPQMLDAAAAAIAELAHEEALVISIIAGKRIADLQARAPRARAFVRAMPNTPAAIGRGVTGAAANDALSERQRDVTRTLLSAIGLFDWLPDEGFIDAVTALSGSGPAYVFALVEAMAAAGAALGLPPDLAMRFARGTVEGAGELLAREPAVSAAQLRQNVTSPGGATAAALRALQSPDGLDALMRKARRRAGWMNQGPPCGNFRKSGAIRNRHKACRLVAGLRRAHSRGMTPLCQAHVSSEPAMPRMLKSFLADESGATAIEYGLIASFIALVIIGAVASTGNKVKGTFNEVTSNLH